MYKGSCMAWMGGGKWWCVCSDYVQTVDWYDFLKLRICRSKENELLWWQIDAGFKRGIVGEGERGGNEWNEG